MNIISTVVAPGYASCSLSIIKMGTREIIHLVELCAVVHHSTCTTEDSSPNCLICLVSICDILRLDEPWYA